MGRGWFTSPKIRQGARGRCRTHRTNRRPLRHHRLCPPYPSSIPPILPAFRPPHRCPVRGHYVNPQANTPWSLRFTPRSEPASGASGVARAPPPLECRTGRSITEPAADRCDDGSSPNASATPHSKHRGRRHLTVPRIRQTEPRGGRFPIFYGCVHVRYLDQKKGEGF